MSVNTFADLLMASWGRVHYTRYERFVRWVKLCFMSKVNRAAFHEREFREDIKRGEEMLQDQIEKPNSLLNLMSKGEGWNGLAYIVPFKKVEDER